ncbi:TetR/AcrR family transcriptional regulator [Leucobacter allii]|uniref:TetR/AcrR family transcriptional regulator n=1 Tax=Leucobacter allii TaxID=2932247 RepID=UPI001FD1FD58|nr:TetR/AcrR family transcriptional regulator [Leucobacter allii]UOR01309.1 TetR/AcrR family transcriptional regulator [Leucobacter allii]
MTTPRPTTPASPAPAPSARRLATRERLLEAAVEVFAEEGLQGASVEAVCQRAGFTRGAFYSNFSSKEELFLALLEREFARRAANLEAKTAEIAPALRDHQGSLDPERAACYITEFLAPDGDTANWYLLETEFALLAMRDPESAPGYAELLTRSYASIAGLVEAAIAAAGRRFTLPAEHAVALLSGEYERALRIEALGAAHTADGLAALPTRISELLFAITEPLAA